MDDPALYALVGAVLPGVIAVINQAHWPVRVRALVALILCVVAATGVAAMRADLHWHDWRAAVTIVAGSALGMYQLWWRPSGWGPAIESATTVGEVSAARHGTSS